MTQISLTSQEIAVAESIARNTLNLTTVLESLNSKHLAFVNKINDLKNQIKTIQDTINEMENSDSAIMAQISSLSAFLNIQNDYIKSNYGGNNIEDLYDVKINESDKRTTRVIVPKFKDNKINLVEQELCIPEDEAQALLDDMQENHYEPQTSEEQEAMDAALEDIRNDAYEESMKQIEESEFE